MKEHVTKTSTMVIRKKIVTINFNLLGVSWVNMSIVDILRGQICTNV